MVGPGAKPPIDGPLTVPINSNDLESGGAGDHRLRRSPSKVTLPSNIHLDSHTANGGDGHDDDDFSQMEWGPEHPCFPHLNPHVPTSSQLYQSSRIIRIPRDWLMAGDLAPTFANVYPEILAAVLSEDEFRNLLRHINDEVTIAFDPFSARAWIDTILGVATFWLWDDLGFTGVKTRLRNLEKWIERWNNDVGSREGVQIIPLRRTAYMSIDIQIPDPHLTSEPVNQPSLPEIPQQRNLEPPEATY